VVVVHEQIDKKDGGRKMNGVCKFLTISLNVLRAIAYVVVMVLTVCQREFIYSADGWFIVILVLICLIVLDLCLMVCFKNNKSVIALIFELLAFLLCAFYTQKVDGAFFAAWALSCLSIYFKATD